MNKQDFFDAIVNRDIEKAKETRYASCALELLENNTEEDFVFFIDHVVDPTNKNVTLQDLFEELIDGQRGCPLALLEKGLNVIKKHWGLETISLTDSEVIYQFMSYPYNDDKVILLDHMNVNCFWLYMFELSALHGYYDLFELFFSRLNGSKNDFNQVLGYLITELYSNYYDVNKKNIDKQIFILLKKFDCDVNHGGFSGDFKYLAQECLYKAPNAFVYFLTEKFDLSIMNNEDFWSVICDFIVEEEQEQARYKDVLIHLKQSGLAIDESLMLNAFNEAELTELVDAYQSA